MSRFTIWIIQPQRHPHMRCFSEVAEALAEALRKLGHEVAEPERSTQPYIVNALPGADKSFGRSIVLGANFLPDAPLPENAIIYNLEQAQLDGVIGDEWQRSNLLRLCRRHAVWDYSRVNILKLRTLGVGDVHHCPIGYVSSWERIEPASVQDIDVLHYGSLGVSNSANGRRRMDVLDALEATTVRDADDTERPMRVEHLFGIYGEERDRYIARAKLVINMHFFQPAIWEVVRCGYLMANRVCVVTENGGQDPDLESLATRGTLSVPYEHIVATCTALVDATGGVVAGGEKVSAEKARKVIAENGYKAIREIDFTESVRRALVECGR